MTPLRERIAKGQPAVSILPAPGQGLSLDSRGRVPVAAPAQSLVVVTADPVTLTDGMVWLRSDLNVLRARLGGATYKWAGTAA